MPKFTQIQDKMDRKFNWATLPFVTLLCRPNVLLFFPHYIFLDDDDLRGRSAELHAYVTSSRRRSARLAGPAGERAGEACEPPDVGAWLGLNHVGALHLPVDGAVGRLEVGAVHEQVSVRAPRPVLPLPLRRIVPRDLLHHSIDCLDDDTVSKIWSMVSFFNINMVFRIRRY